MPKKKKESKKLGKIVLTKKKEKLSLNKIVMPEKRKSDIPKKKKVDEERSTPRPQVQQQFDEPSNFRSIALEELTTEDISGKDIGQGNRWIRVGGEEEKEEKEPAVYDLAKATSSDYATVGDSYQQVGIGGDYDSIQRAGQTTPGFQDPTKQDDASQMDQTKSYDTSGERAEKERRAREAW